jgi:hypothetical protein
MKEKIKGKWSRFPVTVKKRENSTYTNFIRVVIFFVTMFLIM